jgi:protease II
MVVDRNTGIWDVSPDGRYIAYTFWPADTELPNVAVNDVVTGEQLYRFNISPKHILRWTSDGGQLLYEARDPGDTSHQLLARQSVFSKQSSSTAFVLPQVNYFLAIAPSHHSFAVVRGHLVSSAAMLVRN